MLVIKIKFQIKKWRAGILNVVLFGSNTFGKRNDNSYYTYKQSCYVDSVERTFDLNVFYFEWIP